MRNDNLRIAFLCVLACQTGLGVSSLANANASRPASDVVLNVSRELQDSQLMAQGGDHYLLANGDVLRLRCEEGWDGGRTFYTKELVVLPGAEKFRDQTSAQIARALLDSKPRPRERWEFKSTTACFVFRDGCDFAGGKPITLNLARARAERTNRDAQIRSVRCEPRPRSLPSTPGANSGGRSGSAR